VKEGVAADSDASHRYNALSDQTPLYMFYFLRVVNFGSCAIYMGVGCEPTAPMIEGLSPIRVWRGGLGLYDQVHWISTQTFSPMIYMDQY
jgi:hypothetical protein